MTETHLVSTDWLGGASWRAGDRRRGRLLAHARRQPQRRAQEFRARHIPGAVFFDIDAIADKSTDLPHMLPDPVAFSSAMRKLGIGDGFSIVVYDSHGLFSAPRVWWTFRAFGKRDVFILDGGLPKWIAEGRAIAEGEAFPQARHFTCRLDHALVATRDDVKAASARAGEPNAPQIVDARSAGRFRGEETEPRPGVRSRPDSRLVQPPLGGAADRRPAEAGARTGGRFSPRRGSIFPARFSPPAARASPPRSCRWRSPNAGCETAPVYDGSWADWGPGADLPLATGPAQGESGA